VAKWTVQEADAGRHASCTGLKLNAQREQLHTKKIINTIVLCINTIRQRRKGDVKIIHAFSVLGGVILTTTFTKQVGSSSNASDLYCGGVGLECQPRHRLS
jgi:hypothetical protein